jgi:hypothetical protein
LAANKLANLLISAAFLSSGESRFDTTKTAEWEPASGVSFCDQPSFQKFPTQSAAEPLVKASQASFIRSALGTRDGMGRFDLDTTKAQQMKILSALSLLVVIASAGLAPAFASDEAATSATAVKEDTATDCSKQVWPHFTPTCLRNDQATVVRVVAASRR